MELQAIKEWLEEGVEGTPTWVIEKYVSDLIAEVERLRETLKEMGAA